MRPVSFTDCSASEFSSAITSSVTGSSAFASSENPRENSCGRPTGRPLLRTTTVTATNPPLPKTRRSPTVASETSPSTRPCTNILPTGTRPEMRARSLCRSTLTPFSANTMRPSSTPVLAASPALARRCRQVPCTGITLRGRTAL
ncbi:Uncharacterised protein [Mycobacteroides abscessus subsp. abscessus]|nr:Uncharacterised protein [Mycobacteroides abscessus subsp. abscessus]